MRKLEISPPREATCFTELEDINWLSFDWIAGTF
jgi:hypothetical protein